MKKVAENTCKRGIMRYNNVNQFHNIDYFEENKGRKGELILWEILRNM